MQRLIWDTLARLKSHLSFPDETTTDTMLLSDLDRAWGLIESIGIGLQKEARRADQTALDRAITQAQRYLLARQNHEQGYWCWELSADTTLESDYIMLMHFLGQVDKERERKAVRYILSQQQPDGGWNIYRHGPSEISASVKAYFALKLHGLSADDERMRRARQRILALGGADAVNSFTKFYLCLFGQYDWRYVPAVVPEFILLPRFFYFNIYAISSWSRAIVVPLSIIYALRPRAAHVVSISELFQKGKPTGAQPPSRGWWDRFFFTTDRFLKFVEHTELTPFRRLAIKRAVAWMLKRFEHSDGLGAIFPAMVNSIIALRALGHDESSPYLRKALKDFETLVLERGEELKIQPCLSPVWDTAMTMMALRRSGLSSDHPAILSAARWLVQHEVRHEGDWRMSNRRGAVGGWYFEFANEFYPDTDDTAMVLMALQGITFPDDNSCQQACLRGLNWLLSMQSDNGGWGAFDRNNTRHILNHVPFADHNALLDPPTADITGRVLEMLGCYGYDISHERVKRAIAFLKKEQEPDGCWYGRWGVNYIYGTWQVLRGLRAVGVDTNEPFVQKAVQWLKSHQNPDGGWGESCQSYHRPELRGRAPSTPSQTAWAVMGLLSAGLAGDASTQRGVDYLVRTQRTDGGWDEDAFTGTGFPKVFYLEYTGYRDYFPLMALGMYRRMRQS